MRNFSLNLIFTAAITTFFLSANGYAQTASVTVIQDSKFETLLNEKRRINSSITVNDRYKIQIFTGDSENSRRVLGEFRRQYNNFDCTIIFNTPAYKVWIGNFKTRIEAERNLLEIRKVYKNALLIKPNK